ncbi:MAG: PAS domain-containing protein, partial [bacterium]
MFNKSHPDNPVFGQFELCCQHQRHKVVIYLGYVQVRLGQVAHITIERKMSIKTPNARPASIAINLMQENIPENLAETRPNVPFKNFAKTAFDALQEGVCLVDMNLNILYCNKKMAQLFCRNQKPVTGAPLFSLLPKEFHSSIHSKIEFVIKSGDRVDGKFYYQEDDSNSLIYQYEISILKAKKIYPFLMISINTLKESQQNVVTNDNMPHIKPIG